MKKNKKFDANNINVKYVFLVYIVFAIIFMFIVMATSSGVSYKVSDLFDNNSKKVYDELSTVISNQNDVIKKLKKAEINSGYTLDDPYILVNPFNVNPLSAIIVFTTSDETTVNVNINDKDVGTTIANVTHVIPVYGLYSNVNNSVILTLADGTKKDLTILTDEVNTNHEEMYFEFSDSSNLVLRNVVNNDKTVIKGFDAYDTMKFMLDGINGISSFNISGDNIKLLVNGIYVTVDPLGRVVGVTSNDETFIGGDSVEYRTYSNGILDYDISYFKNVNSNTKLDRIKLDDVSETLAKASLYDGTYSIKLTDTYLNIDVDVDGALILVRSDAKVYTTDVKDSTLIKIDDDYEYSLYYKIDNTYYNLYTIVKND